MTIYEIKRRVLSANPDSHYFDRGTMKFFGQTLRSFSVRRVPGGFLISAPMIIYGQVTGKTERFFNPETNCLEAVK